MIPTLEIIKGAEVNAYRLHDPFHQTDVGFFHEFGKGKKRSWGFVPQLNFVMSSADLKLVYDLVEELNEYGEMEGATFSLEKDEWVEK